MYTLNEYLPIVVGDDLPEKGWDSGMYCMETDGVKILRVNLLRGFVSCFAFMLVGTKDFRPVCFQTVHPAVPAFFGQVVAYKYGQIFI